MIIVALSLHPFTWKTCISSVKSVSSILLIHLLGNQIPKDRCESSNIIFVDILLLTFTQCLGLQSDLTVLCFLSRSVHMLWKQSAHSIRPLYGTPIYSHGLAIQGIWLSFGMIGSNKQCISKTIVSLTDQKLICILAVDPTSRVRPSIRAAYWINLFRLLLMFYWNKSYLKLLLSNFAHMFGSLLRVSPASA